MFKMNLNKIILFFICLLFFKSTQVKAQSVSICQGDSAVLQINCAYTGTLQWENSSDQLTWANIIGAVSDTIKVLPSGNTYYRATIASGNCNLTYSDTVVVTVNLIPPAPSILTVDSCGSSRLTASAYTGTLLWSTAQTLNSITVNSAGTYTLTQTLNGCTSAVSSAIASPIAIPVTPTTGTHTASQTQIIWNWNTVTGASGYKYNTVNNYTTATDNLSSLSYTQTGLNCNIAYTLYVWAYNACGNSAVATLTRTSSDCCSIPDAPTVAGTSTCIGSSVTLTASAPGGTYQWYDAPSGGTLLYTGASFSTPALSVNTTYYVHTTVSGCTSLMTTVSVTISSCSGPPGQPSVITSFFGGGTTENPCAECDKYYQVTDESCVSYTWSVPAGWIILSGQGTYRINVDIGTSSGTVSVTPSNGCGSGTAQSVSVDPKGDGYVFPVNNAAGNLFVFSNYDGGTLTIDVDVNIPNIKIGVVSYAPSQIIITGTYAANVVSVHWAGYTGSGTSITPSGIGTIVVTPPATLANSCGNANIICSYTCNYSNCGGCNAPDQIIAYFLNAFPASTFNFHRTHYGVWGSVEKLSTGTNCSY